jgi:hypothetical protein
VRRGSNELDNTSLAVQKSFKLRAFPELIEGRYLDLGTIFCIRVPWDTALRSTFGTQACEQLTRDLRRKFTAGLGSVACIFEHLANGNPEIHESRLSSNIHYAQETFGRGFLQILRKVVSFS